MTVLPVKRNSRVFVAGHRGMVGSAIVRQLTGAGFTNLLLVPSSELDLRDRARVRNFFESERPDIVFLAAAKVGGINANSRFPVDFLSDNILIQLNVMDAALEFGADRLIFMGSSCIYPKFAAQPIAEESLLSGPLEPTNDAYAVAKIAGIKHVEAVRRQFGMRWISVMPSNLFGPGDSYNSEMSHVLPALIRRYEEAKLRGAEFVTNWGSGLPRRELLFVDDLAAACVFLLENYDDDMHINVGSGEDFTISEIASMVSHAIGFVGETRWDESRPDGTPRKLLDSSRIRQLGWRPETSLKDGIQLAVEDFRRNVWPVLGRS